MVIHIQKISTTQTGPLHIPAKRPGFDTDPSVLRHPHPWGASYDAAGFESQYHSQYYIERERKPVYYGYPDAQFPQVNKQRLILTQLLAHRSYLHY